MIQFINTELEMFLGVVRKYMQLRGGLTQKDLAERLNVGVSTMSRFLNQKTKELDPQIIAGIVAVLEVPLHEVIDFVEEDSTDKFKKLVEFYRDQGAGAQAAEMSGEDEKSGSTQEQTRQQTSARIGKSGVKMTFGERRQPDNANFREKLSTLSPRQKVFLTDFLDLDDEGKDLMVDLGNAMFRYFKQRAQAF
jgi:transcriptional regulator with XRE-family HTH domain